MTTGDDLLQAILLDPADDDLRLVYADYLMDNGEQERGEFIRVQIERERAAEAKSALGILTCKNRGLCKGQCSSCVNNTRRQGFRQREEDLATREEQLLNKTPIRGGMTQHVLWLPEELQQGAWCNYRWQWQRGFISYLECTCEQFAADDYALARALFSRHPVEAVRLVDREPWDSTERAFGWWRWQWEENESVDPEDIPLELWALLRAEPDFKSSNYKWYDSVETAHADLSVACCLLGRERAGVTAFAPGNA